MPCLLLIITIRLTCGKKNLVKHQKVSKYYDQDCSFEEQKDTRYIRRNVYFGSTVFSCLSPTKPGLRFLLIRFAQEIKGFYQSSLGNEVDFWDIVNVSTNILAKN